MKGDIYLRIGNLDARTKLRMLLDYLFLLEHKEDLLTAKEVDFLVEYLLLPKEQTLGRIGPSARRLLMVNLKLSSSSLTQRLDDLQRKGYIDKDIDGVKRINPRLARYCELALSKDFCITIDFRDARKTDK